MPNYQWFIPGIGYLVGMLDDGGVINRTKIKGRILGVDVRGGPKCTDHAEKQPHRVNTSFFHDLFIIQERTTPYP